MSLAGRLRGLRPRSFRARIALAITAALAVAVIILQLGLGVFVGREVQAEVESNLRQQAGEVLAAVVSDGVPGAQRAERFLPDTSIVVKRNGETIYFNEAVRQREARAAVAEGDLVVILERESRTSVLANWVVPVILGLALVALGVLVWFLSGRVARRLRADAAALAAQAERVAAGDLEARVAEPESELGRVARALNRMTAKLGETDARQREFLADVAHELRTPVTAIDGFASALADGTARTPEDRAEAAEIIRSEAARLRDLVSDLQQVTLVDAGPAATPEPCDLADLARRAVQRLEPDAQARGIALSGPHDDAPPVPVVTDPGHVDTILTNLLTNALAATPRGGQVAASARTEGAEAVAAVSDTGVGIAAEHLDRVFERLYRVQPGRERTGAGGSGLGLAIVMRLCRVLGGRVAVESAPGAGATFTLRLPAPTGGVPGGPGAAPAREPART